MRHLTIFATASIAALCIASLGACGDDGTSRNTAGSSNTNSGGSSGTAGSGGTGGSTTSTGGNGGSANQCPAPSPMHSGDEAVHNRADAVFVDENGSPAAGVVTTLCGTNICSMPATSNSQGVVAVTDGLGNNMVNPRFNAGHNGRGYAKLSGLIPSIDHDFGTVRVITLPAFSGGVMITPGSDVTHNGVTIGVPVGADVEFDFIDFPDEAEHRFVANVVDVTGFPQTELHALPPSLGIEVIVGTGPLATHICPGVSLTFPNVTGWTAGTAVEIYLNGAVIFDHYAPYGEWAKVADGVVSMDEMTVTTADGQSIEMLGTFGVKPAP